MEERKTGPGRLPLSRGSGVIRKVVPQVYSTCFAFMAKGMAPSASASGYFR